MSLAPVSDEVQTLDYSLVGVNAQRAIEKGLAEADWYQSPITRDDYRELLERRDGPAMRDTLIWFGLLALFGTIGVLWWGSWWAILPFMAYGVLYGSTSDSRWHESSHGTAFKTDWMNNVLYEISSFMVMRESTVWRWSHTRHHSDTIIVGRDPEIAVPRPPEVWWVALKFLGIPAVYSYFKKILLHSTGRLSADEATYIPDFDRKKIYVKARVHLAIYIAVIAACFVMGSILPLMLIGLPNIYGAWLMPIYGLTQHAGLAENVLDHRMNCRTVYMNIVHRYLYWNMNYHVEHHMFPLVPYHNLPRLHALVKDDMPVPYPNLFAAWKEIVLTVTRQVKDPGYYVRRKLPTPSVRAIANVAAKTVTNDRAPDTDGWVNVGDAAMLMREDVLRFDHAGRTLAVYRTADDRYHATDGICTHGNTHLATGMVKGDLIECPKHNGRFDVRDGSPKRPPVCVALRTYPVEVADGQLRVNVRKPGGLGAQQADRLHAFTVVSSRNVATFIREVVVEPADGTALFGYQPGQYVQVVIPSYERINFSGFDIDARFRGVWTANHVVDYASTNRAELRRNYSIASNPAVDRQLRFNVRIATPPAGQDCPAGAGSSYMWNLRPGDRVSLAGPFGNFLIKQTNRPMVYLGGGAGMAPLRSHLSHVLETLKTDRPVSFWYGARSRQEIFYQDYFEDLARRHANFQFHVALSEPLPEDQWTGHTGYIHEVLRREHLSRHADPAGVEYYLCGPQPMIQASRKMLAELGIASDRIAYDEF